MVKGSGPVLRQTRGGLTTATASLSQHTTLAKASCEVGLERSEACAMSATCSTLDNQCSTIWGGLLMTGGISTEAYVSSFCVTLSCARVERHLHRLLCETLGGGDPTRSLGGGKLPQGGGASSKPSWCFAHALPESADKARCVKPPPVVLPPAK